MPALKIMWPTGLRLTLFVAILNVPLTAAAFISVPLTTFRDGAYAVDVAFGTPPQMLKLSIDISSEYSANVYSFLCRQCCHHARYDWRESSTGECRYEDSHLPFAFCNDSLEIAGRSVPNARFEETLYYDVDQSIFNQAFDGYIGLSSLLPDNSSGGMWTFFVPERTCTNDVDVDAGYLSLGDADSVHCELQGLEWLPMSRDGGLSAEYTIHLESAQVGGVNITGGPWVAVLSTTANSVTVPGLVFDQLKYVWEATGVDVNGNIVCKVASPSSLSLMFGRVEFEIHFDQLMDQVGTNCTLLVRSRGEYAGPPAVAQQWVVGLPFAWERCQLYDFEHARVAFTRPRIKSNARFLCEYTEPPTSPQPCVEPKISTRTAVSTPKSSATHTRTSRKQRALASSTSALVNTTVQPWTTTVRSTWSPHDATTIDAAGDLSTPNRQEFTTSSTCKYLATAHSLFKFVSLILLSLQAL